MHGDHTFGLVPFLCALADGGGGAVNGQDPRDKTSEGAPPIEIYGLTGTRQLIRTTLTCTYTHLARRYRVHELLFDKDEAYRSDYLHRNELPGDDIRIGSDGVWKHFVGSSEKMKVSAVPIKHTVPCVGFIFEEPPRPGSLDGEALKPILLRNKEALAKPPWSLKNPLQLMKQLKEAKEPITLPDGEVLEPPRPDTNGRKLVILGDTYDAESPAMDDLAKNPDLVVHESTNAFLPGLDDAIKPEDTMESIAAKSRDHGHSTPQVAGRFAKCIGARSLFLNHFSARYIDAGDILAGQDEQGHVAISETVTVIAPGRDASEAVESKRSARSEEDKELRLSCMREIVRQATEAWGSQSVPAVATRDFMSVIVRRRHA